jgi:acyl dehydratase
MPLDYQKLKNWPFKERVQAYTPKDCMLYALGLGLGADPLDAHQLRFVYEKELQVLPTMAVVLASPGFWLQDPGTGVNWKAVLHGEQGLTIHRPLHPSGTLIGKMSIDEIVDKGAGKGALIYSRRDLYDQQSGELMCSLTSTSFCRGEGGFGGPTGPTRAPHELPSRAPDASCDLRTLPQAALIYRLSGDYNPLHADPSVAASVGFEQPILHGLCTYGVAGYAILTTLCGHDPARLRRLDVRFSAPVYPGETIRTEIWNEAPGRASFRSSAVERDIVVLNNGVVEYTTL